jgi:hypothetical protein
MGWAQYGIHLLLENLGILVLHGATSNLLEEEESGRLYRILPPNEISD